MAIVALAIKCTSPGPVFERQKRISDAGQPFLFLRFRISAQPGGMGRVSVTPLGRFLHWLRIDELPQLLNLVRGHMTFADLWQR